MVRRLTLSQRFQFEAIDRECDQVPPPHTCRAEKCGAFRSRRGCLALMEYFEYCDAIRITYLTARGEVYFWRCCGRPGRRHPYPSCHPSA